MTAFTLSAGKSSVRRTAMGRASVRFATALACVWFAAAAKADTTAASAAPEGPRVLIFSIDGLRPDCLLRADTPNIRHLMNVGSFSMWARTTDVAITIPSHTSMVTGVKPETHGIDFNGDPPEDAQIKVPTLFDLAKAKGYSTGMASGKRKFTLFAHSGHMDYLWTPGDTVVDDASTANHAIDIIQQHQPQVMYVHFGATDSTGHGIGWGTPEQLQTIHLADKAVGRVVDEYKALGLLSNTYIILSADHGGTLRGHGKDDMRSRYIPWIAVGPNVRSDFDLTRMGKDYEVATYDTFATACYVLGIETPEGIAGKPVMPIFLDNELMQSDAPAKKAAPAPQAPTATPTSTAAPATQPAAQVTAVPTEPAAPTPAEVAPATQPTTLPAIADPATAPATTPPTRTPVP